MICCSSFCCIARLSWSRCTCVDDDAADKADKGAWEREWECLCARACASCSDWGEVRDVCMWSRDAAGIVESCDSEGLVGLAAVEEGANGEGWIGRGDMLINPCGKGDRPPLRTPLLILVLRTSCAGDKGACW